MEMTRTVYSTSPAMSVGEKDERGPIDHRTQRNKLLANVFRNLPSVKLASCEQIPLLGHDPIALCVGIVTIVAAFDTTTPTNTRFGINILSAIQPVVVSRALHGVNARLIDRVRVVRHSDERVISVVWIISDTATFETAME